VEFNAPGNLAIYDSRFTDNAYGLAVLNAASQAFVHHTSFDHNTFGGVYTPSGVATVTDSSAHFNNAGFSSGGTLVLSRDQSVLNVSGLSAVNVSATMQFSACSIALNSLYSYSTNAATISGSTPGTSLVNGTTNGSLSAPGVLQ